MTRRYEIVYIFGSAAEEAQVNEALERLHALLKTADNPEPIRNVNHWGKRSLAYPIQNNEVGYYVVVDMNIDPAALPEFERALKLDESVIRYLLVLNEGEMPRAVPTAEEAEREREAAAVSPEGDAAPSAPATPEGEAA